MYRETKNSTIRDYASIVDMCEVNRDIIKFNFAKPSEQDIKELLFEFYEYNEEYLKKCSDFLIKYVEQAEYKEYYSSWGTSIKQEYNHFGIIIDIEIGIDNNLFFDEFNIWVGVYKRGEEIIFWIENETESIDEKEIPKLCDAFYRIDKSRNKRTGGSGLGLYITKMILEQHQFPYCIENTEKGIKVEIRCYEPTRRLL